ncbi:MAG: YopX family protein [Dissulfurispiraceae bacterium]
MRELNFRAWDLDGKCWIPQAQLAIAALDGHKDILTYQQDEDRWIAETIRFVVMQYTGFKDAKDKDIYEGDILMCHENGNLSVSHDSEGKPCGVVIFADDSGSFLVTQFGVEEQEYVCNVGAEIIGNIYEHPYLLRHCVIKR